MGLHTRGDDSAQAVVTADSRGHDVLLRRVAIAACVVLLVATLLPLALIAPFDHSASDDLGFGLDTHRAVLAGGGLLEVLGAAAGHVVHMWKVWQGSYSAMFIMALQPGVFSEAAYAITPFVTVGLLGSAVFYLAWVLMVRWLGLSRGLWLATSCMVLAQQVLQQPSAVEGLFWYNGATYYTGFLAFLLFYMALVFKLLYLEPRHVPALAVGLSLLGFLIGGGNYVVVLLSWEVIAMLLVPACLQRERRARVLQLLPSVVILVAGSLVNCLAPGNAEREQHLGGMGMGEAFFRSVRSGVSGAVDGTNLIVILGIVVICLLAAPELAHISRRVRRPWLVPFLSYELYCSSFAPTYYAMGSAGPGRVQGLRFDLLMVLLMANALLATALLVRQRSGQAAGDAAHASPGQRRACGSASLAVLLEALLVVSILGVANGGDRIVPYTALRSLYRGEAQAYSEQVWSQIAAIEADPSADVSVPAVTAHPPTIFNQELSEDPTWWVNVSTAQWYGKDTISVYYPAGQEE